MCGKYTLAAWTQLWPFCLILYSLFHRGHAIFLNESLGVFPGVPSQKNLLGLKSRQIHPFAITLLVPHWEDKKSSTLLENASV